MISYKSALDDHISALLDQFKLRRYFMDQNRAIKLKQNLWRRVQVLVVILLTLSGIAFAFEARALACDAICTSSACNIGSGGLLQ